MHGRARHHATISTSVLVIFSLTSCCRANFDNENYCSLQYRDLCDGRGEHVACQYPEKGPGLSCTGYTEVVLDNFLKQSILEFINSLRQRVATGVERGADRRLLPRAKHMLKVEWDDELAYLAQRVADQCVFQHDSCRATTRFPYAGQNLGLIQAPSAYGAGSGADEYTLAHGVRRVLAKWARERQLVHPRALLRPFEIHRDKNGTIMIGGHYTQLVKASSSYIGCGVSRWSEGILLVCDHSRSNVLGEPTYAGLDLDMIREYQETIPKTEPQKNHIDAVVVDSILSTEFGEVGLHKMLHTRTSHRQRASAAEPSVTAYGLCPSGHRLDTDRRFNRLCVPQNYHIEALTETHNADKMVADYIRHREKPWITTGSQPLTQKHLLRSKHPSDDRVAEQLYLDTGFRRTLRPARLARDVTKTTMTQGVQRFTKHNRTTKTMMNDGVWQQLEGYLQDKALSSSSMKKKSKMYLTSLFVRLFETFYFL